MVKEANLRLLGEDKFHIYKQPCIIFLSYKQNSPLLTNNLSIQYRAGL